MNGSESFTIKNTGLEKMEDYIIQKYGKIALNQKESASVLGVAPSTLDRWRAEGVGPKYKKINMGKRGRVIYPVSCLVEFLNDTIETV